MLTHFNNKSLFLVWVFSLSLTTPLYVKATTLEESEQELAKANNAYYEALLEGGKKSPEERKAIEEKYLTPAYQKMDKTLKESNEKFVGRYLNIKTQEEIDKEITQAERENDSLKDEDVKDISKNPFLKNLVTDFFKDETAIKTFGKSSDRNPATSNSGNSDKATKLSDVKESGAPEETVIDRKDTPKLIEFKGKKK